jgi:UDP-N-acetylmuramoyl-tripeptide--D-alanyl-D-alanine ligase
VIPTTLRAIADVTGGSVHDADEELLVTAPVTIDSRSVEPGGLFVAFVGEHVDGHDFAAAAVEAGAVAVLGTRPLGPPAVVVDDPQDALGRMAHHHLGRLPDVTVVAVTGSQGKTSTKDMLAVVLAGTAPTVATYGSFNNEIGLPLTVLRADDQTRYLVLEMGARGVGHLRSLCALAQPDVSLVLNVGKAHVGEFGSVEGIAQAKGELVEALEPDGVAVLNADDPLVAAMSARTEARVLTFGSGDAADVRLSGLTLDDRGRPTFELTHAGESVPVRLQLTGAHQARNAAAAVAAAVAAGVPFADAAGCLDGIATLSRWRMEVSERPDGVTVVNDAYNANPDSTLAALEALVAMGGGKDAPRRRTVAVLGEMRELGESSATEHTTVGRLAVRLGVRQLLVVGDAARAMHEGATAEGGESVFVADNDAAVWWLREHIEPYDVVLVKASRGAQLDTVAEALLADTA